MKITKKLNSATLAFLALSLLAQVDAVDSRTTLELINKKLTEEMSLNKKTREQMTQKKDGEKSKAEYCANGIPDGASQSASSDEEWLITFNNKKKSIDKKNKTLHSAVDPTKEVALINKKLTEEMKQREKFKAEEYTDIINNDIIPDGVSFDGLSEPASSDEEKYWEIYNNRSIYKFDPDEKEEDFATFVKGRKEAKKAMLEDSFSQSMSFDEDRYGK